MVPTRGLPVPRLSRSVSSGPANAAGWAVGAAHCGKQLDHPDFATFALDRNTAARHASCNTTNITKGHWGALLRVRRVERGQTALPRLQICKGAVPAGPTTSKRC